MAQVQLPLLATPPCALPAAVAGCGVIHRVPGKYAALLISEVFAQRASRSMPSKTASWTYVSSLQGSWDYLGQQMVEYSGDSGQCVNLVVFRHNACLLWRNPSVW